MKKIKKESPDVIYLCDRIVTASENVSSSNLSNSVSMAYGEGGYAYAESPDLDAPVAARAERAAAPATHHLTKTHTVPTAY